jgi:hypothetical protein
MFFAANGVIAYTSAPIDIAVPDIVDAPTTHHPHCHHPVELMLTSHMSKFYRRRQGVVSTGMATAGCAMYPTGALGSTGWTTFRFKVV